MDVEFSLPSTIVDFTPVRSGIAKTLPLYSWYLSNFFSLETITIRSFLGEFCAILNESTVLNVWEEIPFEESKIAPWISKTYLVAPSLVGRVKEVTLSISEEK